VQQKTMNAFNDYLSPQAKAGPIQQHTRLLQLTVELDPAAGVLRITEDQQGSPIAQEQTDSIMAMLPQVKDLTLDFQIPKHILMPLVGQLQQLQHLTCHVDVTQQQANEQHAWLATLANLRELRNLDLAVESSRNGMLELGSMWLAPIANLQQLSKLVLRADVLHPAVLLQLPSSLCELQLQALNAYWEYEELGIYVDSQGAGLVAELQRISLLHLTQLVSLTSILPLQHLIASPSSIESLQVVSWENEFDGHAVSRAPPELFGPAGSRLRKLEILSCRISAGWLQQLNGLSTLSSISLDYYNHTTDHYDAAFAAMLQHVDVFGQLPALRSLACAAPPAQAALLLCHCSKLQCHFFFLLI
jgi:hypothetical protein